MFTKKQSVLEIQQNFPQNLKLSFTKQSLLQSNHLNHQFFLLVRDKQYLQAYILGQKLFKQDPYNTAVSNFCDFIKNNMHDLINMKTEEEEYTDDEDEDEQQDEDQEDDDDDQQEQNDEEQRERKQSTGSKKQQKQPFRNSTNSLVSKSSINSKSSSFTSIQSSSSIKSSLPTNNSKPLPATKNKKLQLPKISSNNNKPLTISSKALNKQNAHKWQHKCKNPNCPNKNKPHRHSNSSNGLGLFK